MRKKIVQRRIEEAEKDGRTLPADEHGKNEPTLFNKDNGNEIRLLMRRHLHWHPFKTGRRHQFPGPELSTRAIWMWQAKEMHDKCASLGEGYAWEYLWKNWYKLDHWKIWARSAHLDHYPIIQTNAAVEAHWSVLKYRGLRWFHRPRLDHLCATLHEQLLPIFVTSVYQVRKKLKPPGWYKLMITDWRQILETIRAEDIADAGSVDGTEAESRLIRMQDLHSTDIDSWSCTCTSYMLSPYHICKHLARLYGASYPTKRECSRQRTMPLLFITSIHSLADREVVTNPTHPAGSEQPTSLAEIGVTEEDLQLLESTFPQQTGDEEDPRSGEAARIQEIEQLNDQLFLIIQYNKDLIKNYHSSHRHYSELPKATLSQVPKFYKIAAGAQRLDRRRTQVGTFAKEREGNIFRET